MNREKRGGAHLEKNLSSKKTAPNREQPAPASSRREEEPAAGPERKKKIILIVALVLAGVAVIGGLVSWMVGGLFADDGLLGGLPPVPDYEDTLNTDGNLGPVRSKADSKRKEEFYTFLVVGRDTGGGGNTDTIMFCSYDIPNQKLTVMSIPRDTVVDARHPDKNKRINGVWNLGLYYAEKGSKKEGIDYLREAVGDMTGIVPDFHVIINWEAFGRLVDTIGGVDFEVPFEMKYKDPTQDLIIDQAAGYRHLTGDDAMQVVRWRHNNSGSVQYADADLGRIRTQQALMKAIIEKCLRLENVTKINEFAEIFSEEVETDLTVGNLLAFAQRALFGGLEMDNVVFTTMPLSSTPVKGGMVQADPEELLGLLNESLNPYVKDLQMEELRVMQYSSSRGYYVYQGTGTGTAPTHSSDNKPAQAVTKPETTATPKPDHEPEPSDKPEPSDEPDSSSSPKPSPEASQKPSQGPSQKPDDPSDAPDEPSEKPSQDPEDTPEPSEAPAEPSAAPERDPLDMGIPME